MIKRALRPYQSEAHDKAIPYVGFALFPEPRTGKTLIAYSIADRRKPDRLLVVCPKTAVGEWHAGLDDWVGHRCDVMIVTFGIAVSRRKAICRWLEKAERPGMIVDELHKIKRRGSKQSKAVRVLGRRADWRLGLTGTPIAQGLEDAWAYFDYLDPSVFGKYKKFEKRFLKMGGFKRFNRYTKRWECTKIVGYKNKKTFARILAKYSYRVRLGEVTPTKMKLRRVKVRASLCEREAKAYREIEKELRTYVRGERVTAPLVITQSMKLHEITGGFVISDTRRLKDGKRKPGKVLRVGSSKMTLLKGVLDGVTPGEKVVVIARFRHELRAIRRLLVERGLSVQLIGKEDPWTREFKTDAVLLQIAMAASIDLSASKRIIFYSWDYSYINFEQARFRVLSYHQTRATYYFLMIRDSIDELLYKVIAKKGSLASLVCDRYRRKK